MTHVTESAAQRGQSRGTGTMTWAVWPRRPSSPSQTGGLGYPPSPPQKETISGLRRRPLWNRTDAASFMPHPGRERAGECQSCEDGRQTRALLLVTVLCSLLGK